jgi:DNA (cytosine-5)-methyltransferase 1
MKAFYNENDPLAAAWLRGLADSGSITEGTVCDESIERISGAALHGFERVHFFAGIGGWDYALKLAGWPAGREVWTGSCPCQPFSGAGKMRGEADERHLWPEMRRLIGECRPATIFGEQVASKLGREWLDGVFADLEAMGYRVAGADLCAAGVGAPHIRQRLYWVAQSGCESKREHLSRSREGVASDRSQASGEPGRSGGTGRVADAELHGRERITKQHSTGILETVDGKGEPREPTGTHSTSTGGVADRECERLQGFSGDGNRGREPGRVGSQKTGSAGAGRATGWDGFDIIPCYDGKQRRIESGTFPLAHGIPRGVVPDCPVDVAYALSTGEARKMRLKGYGNAIVPQVAAAFIRAFIAEALRREKKENNKQKETK